MLLARLHVDHVSGTDAARFLFQRKVPLARLDVEELLMIGVIVQRCGFAVRFRDEMLDLDVVPEDAPVCHARPVVGDGQHVPVVKAHGHSPSGTGRHQAQDVTPLFFRNEAKGVFLAQQGIAEEFSPWAVYGGGPKGGKAGDDFLEGRDAGNSGTEAIQLEGEYQGILGGLDENGDPAYGPVGLRQIFEKEKSRVLCFLVQAGNGEHADSRGPALRFFRRRPKATCEQKGRHKEAEGG